MKKNIFSLAIILSAAFISCTSKNNEADGSAVIATDSSMMAKDNTQQTVTAEANPSSAMANTITHDSASAVNKVEMAKPDLSKKGKKGKVSIVMDKTTGDMTPDKEGYYTNAEVLPGYPGGQKALEHFFETNMQYPQEASDNGIEGTVKINFAVDETGKIYSPKVTGKNIGYGMEAEALRVFNKMPNWTPGRIKGKNVKTRFNLPVRFQLL